MELQEVLKEYPGHCPVSAAYIPDASNKHATSVMNALNSNLSTYTKSKGLPLMKVVGFEKSSALDKDKAVMYCEVHGYGDEFGNPWRPIVNHLRKKRNGKPEPASLCPLCRGNYRPTFRETILDIQCKLANTYCRLVGLIIPRNMSERDSKKDIKCLIRCEKHGNCWQFEKSYTPSVNEILYRGRSCAKCRAGYRASESELMNELKRKYEEHIHLTFLGVLGSWRGKESTLDIVCETHGRLADFANPQKPKLELWLKPNQTSNCVKCLNIYQPTESEAFNEVDSILRADGCWLDSFVSNYRGRSTKCTIGCNVHGILSSYNDYKYADIDAIVNQKVRCYLCARQGHQLSSLLKKTELFSSSRILYYARFTAFETGTKFYKIGISTRELHKRYPAGSLENRNLNFCVLSEVILPNIVACVAEVIILATYSSKRCYPRQMCNWGITECFESDVLSAERGTTLKDLIPSVIPRFEAVLSCIGNTLNERDTTAAKDSWEMIVGQLNLDLSEAPQLMVAHEALVNILASPSK